MMDTLDRIKSKRPSRPYLVEPIQSDYLDWLIGVVEEAIRIVNGARHSCEHHPHFRRAKPCEACRWEKWLEKVKQ